MHLLHMLGKASTEMEVRRIATVIYKVRIGTVRYKNENRYCYQITSCDVL